MSTRAEKFLEGFKLGSLGAGRRFSDHEVPQVPSPGEAPKQKIKVQYEVTKQSLGNTPRIRWEDFDGLIYMMVVNSSTKHLSESDWYVEIQSGFPQNPGEDPTKTKKWKLRTEMMTPGRARKLYRYYLPIVKEKGIDGIIALNQLKDFEPLPEYRSNLTKWFHDKKEATKKV